MNSAAGAQPQPHPGMGFRQFVTLMAFLMAINALAIDAMLPALPAIGDALGVAADNDRQWIITAYLLGFGSAQLFYGPLSDRFGRRPVLLAGLAIFVVFAAAATFAPNFETLLIIRALQGVGTASTRVLSVSIVRDSYSGRRMARVMSLTFIVFMTVPILAPSLGQAILLVAPWQWIFGALAFLGGVVGLWAAARLPETLHQEYRRPLELRAILNAFRITLTTRESIGYTLAMSAVMGGLFGFIGSAQQIFDDVFDQATLFPVFFAVTAMFMAVSSWLNASIVERLGTRRVSHSALIGFIFFSGVHAIVVQTGHESVWTFAVLQSCVMFCFGLLGANFGAMAMEPLGPIAGAASSVQGFCTTIGGALVGFFIGQQFDGTAGPLTLGFTVCGIVALALVIITEKGRLFQPHQPSTAR